MSNRTFIGRTDGTGTIIKREVRLYCAVAVGAAGAVTLQKWNYPTLGTGGRVYSAAATGPAATGYPLNYQAGAEGIRSVVRTAAGLWTVTLQDSYQRMVGLAGYSSLAGGLSAIVGVAENTTTSNFALQNGAVIGIALLSATATALDPASGEVVKLSFTLSDATEP
jgi:hypothetical protein